MKKLEYMLDILFRKFNKNFDFLLYKIYFKLNLTNFGSILFKVIMQIFFLF